ncbi:MAG TPA: hypothetical protein VF595_01110 [Tepidisphaeraceae bacterium]|jgi:hypothetical protein
MADTYKLAAEILTINNKNAKSDLNITDLLVGAPLLNTIYATQSSNGIVDAYFKLTALPSVGFREINYGLDHTPSGKTLVTNRLRYEDCGHTPIDVAAVRATNENLEDLVAEEIKLAIQAGMTRLEWQILNGVYDDGDPLSGFNGLKALVDATYVYKANSGSSSGITPTANKGNSIYLIRSVPDMTGVCSVFNGETSITVGDTYVGKANGLNNKPFDAYMTPIGAWAGLRIGSKQSVARICNITDQAGLTATDNMVFDAVSKAPAGRPFTHAVMSAKLREQIRKSRVATNPTGAQVDSPVTVAGLPIIVTDALVADLEAIV